MIPIQTMRFIQHVHTVTKTQCLMQKYCWIRFDYIKDVFEFDTAIIRKKRFTASAAEAGEFQSVICFAEKWKHTDNVQLLMYTWFYLKENVIKFILICKSLKGRVSVKVWLGEHVELNRAD